MEGVREAHGDHQTLLELPSHWGKPQANGAVWGKALDRWTAAKHGNPDSQLTDAVGTLFRASQFLSEELPIRLAHRVQELGDLPDGLNDMPSIKKVQDWYAQSFEVCSENARQRPVASIELMPWSGPDQSSPADDRQRN